MTTDLETLRRHEAALVQMVTTLTVPAPCPQQDALDWALARVREAIAKAERCPSCSGCGFQERQGSPDCDACKGTGKR
jgi:hypothetical protein